MPGPAIQEEALGTSYSFNRDGMTVTLQLPSRPAEFYEPQESETIYVPALSPEQSSMAETPRIWALNLIRVTVELDGIGSMQDKQSMPFDALEHKLDESWRRGHAISGTEVGRFTSWLRVETQQSWLGTGDEPSMQYGRSYLREVGQEGFLIAYGEQQTVIMRHGGIGASRENLGRIQTHLEAGEDVPAELDLFADARYFARESDLIDGQRAVLSASMAAEIATKKAILRQVTAERKPAVELLLRQRSNVPDLVSDIARVAIGRSLKADDPALFRELRELNDLRNRIVHTGARVDRQTAYRLSYAVEKLMTWLR
jgi:hypothetical protein